MLCQQCSGSGFAKFEKPDQHQNLKADKDLHLHQSEKPRTFEDYNGARKAHPGADVAHNRAVKAHN
jgi:hypothetical protein